MPETSPKNGADDAIEPIESTEEIESGDTDAATDSTDEVAASNDAKANKTRKPSKADVDAETDTEHETGGDKKLDAKRRKEAERKRIARSKQIAAEARLKGGASSRRDKKTGSDASMTKEQLRASGRVATEDENPVWFKPIMFGFLILGFLWIIVYYLSQGRLPVAELADWNILVGFGIALVGFLMMSNWK